MRPRSEPSSTAKLQMQKRLAGQDRATTMLPPEPNAASAVEVAVPKSKSAGTVRPAPKSARRAPAKSPSSPSSPDSGPQIVPEHFYRDLVWNLRNGVVAVTSDGLVAVMNDVAHRI